jgi:hypothetical protein
MADSFLQRIVKDLKQKDPKEKNIYLDKIISNLNQYRKDANKSIQQEILEEVAYSLRKVESQLRLSLLECEKLFGEYKVCENKEEILKKYDEAKKRALQEKWKFMVQRESLGLIWTEDLEKMYPNPKELKDS